MNTPQANVTEKSTISNKPSCPVCNSTVTIELGFLASLLWYRCSVCDCDYSHTNPLAVLIINHFSKETMS
jgi:hypothetical protein